MVMNELCLILVSTVCVGNSLETSGIHYAPYGQGGIWIDVKTLHHKNDSRRETSIEKAPQLALGPIKAVTRVGPKCFACSGPQCATPRLTGYHADLQCDYGDVCWTIETIERTVDNEKSVYFRGCGRIDEQKCGGALESRAPARSTAGQRKDANGPEYCDWGAAVSQCKSCCVNDHCNGARLFESLTNEALDGLANGAPQSFGLVGFDGLLGRATYEGAIRRCCFVAVVWWIALLITFPPR